AGRERLQEPDVRHRGGQLDVAHALAAHLGERHLHAALLADQALILHALVLAAQALVILDRPEDAGAEQPVPLRLEGAVVDGLGLLDLAERPRADALRPGDRDADVVEGLRALGLAQHVDQVGHGMPRSRKWVDAARPSGGAAGQGVTRSSSTLRPSERSSLTSTLNDS